MKMEYGKSLIEIFIVCHIEEKIYLMFEIKKDEDNLERYRTI